MLETREKPVATDVRDLSGLITEYLERTLTIPNFGYVRMKDHVKLHNFVSATLRRLSKGITDAGGHVDTTLLKERAGRAFGGPLPKVCYIPTLGDVSVSPQDLEELVSALGL